MEMSFNGKVFIIKILEIIHLLRLQKFPKN